MKITADAKSFSEAITWSTKNFDGKDTQAFVALVVNEDGTAHLFHSNPTSYMKSGFQVLDAEVAKDELTKRQMTLAMEGKFLQRLGSNMGSLEGAIVLEKKSGEDKSTLTVTTGNGVFTVPLFATSVGNEPPLITLGEVDDREYFDALQRLSKLCDAKNKGYIPVLGTVDILLDPEGSKATMMATDRYALGEISVAFDPAEEAAAYVEENGNILLPVENATLIAPSKGLTSSTTLVYESKGKKFGYQFSDGRVALFSLKDAEPLAYGNLKTKAAQNVKNSLQVEASELKQAIQTIAMLAEVTDIYFEINEEGLLVCDASRSNTLRVEATEVELEEDFTVKFVYSIISEAFSPISTNRMNMKWATAKSPFLLEAVLDDGTVNDNVFVFAMTSG